MNKKLLIIIPDRLSALVQKGEIIPRYYNPGNIFDEVHLVMTNDDQPDSQKIQLMVGRAQLFLYNFPPPAHFFKHTLGWQFFLLRNWTKKFLALVKHIQPDLVRTHNNFLEGYLAFKVKEKFLIPFVTSLHGIWDIDDLTNLKSKIHRFFRKKIEVITLKNADAVICVYSAIIKYAKKHGAKNPFLIQNFVGGDFIHSKTNWNLSNPIKLITVNRQLPEKNPENIIKALFLLPYSFDYTIIGDGIYHEALKNQAKNLSPTKKITFIKSLPNEEICKLYAISDFMLSNCHYKGISKTIIEAGLSSLPIIINHYTDGYQLSEYQGEWLKECPDTPQGYAAALNELIKDPTQRQSLAQKALKKTTENFSPQVLENKVCTVYNALLK